MKKVIRLKKNKPEELSNKSKITESLLKTLEEIDTELDQFFNKKADKSTLKDQHKNH